MPYNITLLGTDTKFTPNPDGCYPKGETLSVVASELLQDTYTVFDGPNTFGSNVQEIIQQALALIKAKISTGEKIFNISAHSRGGVEAIILAHEVQSYLDAEGIRDVKLNLFVIDPVPGGNLQGIPTRWKDARFYAKLPPCVKNYTQILLAHERSRSFKPIVPDHDPNHTRFSLVSLPGHHGTASGSLKAHGGVEVTEGALEHVPLLTMRMLEDFLLANDAKFTQDVTKLEPCEEKDLYEKIQKNKEAYSQLSHYTYPTGREQSWRALLGLEVHDDRIIHYKGPGDTLLNLVALSSANYVNSRHLELCIQKQFSSVISPGNFKEFIEILYKTADHVDRHNSDSPDDSVLADDSAHAISQDPDLLYKAIDYSLLSLVNIYLYGNISAHEKPALLTDIIDALEKFKPEGQLATAAASADATAAASAAASADEHVQKPNMKNEIHNKLINALSQALGQKMQIFLDRIEDVRVNLTGFDSQLEYKPQEAIVEYNNLNEEIQDFLANVETINTKIPYGIDISILRIELKKCQIVKQRVENELTETKRLQDALTQATERNQELQERLNASNTQQDRLQEQLNANNAEHGGLQNQLDARQQQLNNIFTNFIDSHLRPLSNKFATCNFYNPINDILQSAENAATKCQQFFEYLQGNKQDIIKDNGSNGKRYIKNVLIAFAIFFTGIVPGILGLSLWAYKTDNSMRYWRSEGQNFFDKATKIQEQYNKLNPPVA